jgi:hypothetical protein
MPSALRSRFAAAAKIAGKLLPPLAFAFSHGCLILALLFYPAFLQLGAHNGGQGTLARDQFDFCSLTSGESAQSCAISTRLFVRFVQSEAGDERACVQASSFGKFILHPARAGTWDKASLRLYANVFEDSDWESKWLKARLAAIMLKQHRKIDERCWPPAQPDESYPVFEMPAP